MGSRIQVIVNLIANTTTQAGLKIRAELDRGKYPTGIKITDAELALLNLKSWRMELHDPARPEENIVTLFMRES